jgi:hypothetical protein
MTVKKRNGWVSEIPIVRIEFWVGKWRKTVGQSVGREVVTPLPSFRRKVKGRNDSRPTMTKT